MTGVRSEINKLLDAQVICTAATLIWSAPIIVMPNERWWKMSSNRLQGFEQSRTGNIIWPRPRVEDIFFKAK